MQLLYETDSVWSLEEYAKFNYAVCAKQITRLRNTYYILAACMFVLGVVTIVVPFLDTAFGVILLIAVVLYLCLYQFRTKGKMDRSIKTTWETDKTIQNATPHISFYEDRLVSEDEHSTERLDYTDIHKIIETDRNFYIMLSEIKGMNIIKANCSDELIEFIRTLNEIED